MSSSSLPVDNLSGLGGRLAAARDRLTWPALRHAAIRSGWWVGVYLLALVIFGAFVLTRGVDPISMYLSMWHQTITNTYGFGQVIDKMAPFALAGLAVVVPARAGLVNIGGEGQLVIGATAAGGVSIALGTHLTGWAAIVLMALGGMAGGAAWAGIAALLKLAGNVNEAIATLLLNYVAFDVLSYLVYGPWINPAGNGQPVSKPLPSSDYLPTVASVQANIGILFAVAAAVAVILALRNTRWGFALRAVGGNREAARRAGLKVPMLLLSAMLVGGALAGLGGMVQYAGVEGQLVPGVAATFGYTGFLASWLGRHQPAKVLAAAFLLAAIAVSGNALQLSSGLPGEAVNILLGVVLLVVLAQRPRPRAA